jgi:hypothetical protein
MNKFRSSQRIRAGLSTSRRAARSLGTSTQAHPAVRLAAPHDLPARRAVDPPARALASPRAAFLAAFQHRSVFGSRASARVLFEPPLGRQPRRFANRFVPETGFRGSCWREPRIQIARVIDVAAATTPRFVWDLTPRMESCPAQRRLACRCETPSRARGTPRRTSSGTP